MFNKSSFIITTCVVGWIENSSADTTNKPAGVNHPHSNVADVDKEANDWHYYNTIHGAPSEFGADDEDMLCVNYEYEMLDD